ncbi:MAG: hypothetical protein R2729_28030 [Bryobacteraceae bacterium]
MFGGILGSVTKMLGPAGFAIDILGGLLSKKGGSTGSAGGGFNIAEMHQARLRLQEQLGRVTALQQQLSIGQNGTISIRVSAQALPFSAPAGSPMADAMKNPFGALGSLKDLLGPLMPALENALRQLSGGGTSGAASSAAPAPESASSVGSGPSASAQASSSPASSSGILSSESQWGNIDSMMAEAEKLAMSKNPSDQLKAQKLMQQAQQMFQTISKLLSQLADMFKTAMGNVK